MKIPGISRIEGPQGRGSGWMVRITRQGTTTHKWFADGLFGGKAKALAAARKHHKMLVAKAPPIEPIKGRKTSRNRTGKVGVRLENKITTRGKKDYAYENYVAFWTGADGNAQTITFSCDKYGKRGAFRMASIARDAETTDRKWIERRYGASKAAGRA